MDGNLTNTLRQL